MTDYKTNRWYVCYEHNHYRSPNYWTCKQFQNDKEHIDTIAEAQTITVYESPNPSKTFHIPSFLPQSFDQDILKAQIPNAITVLIDKGK